MVDIGSAFLQIGRGITDPARDLFSRLKGQTAKGECESRGPEWRWNEATKTCDKIPQTPKPAPAPEVKVPNASGPKSGEVIRNADTGKLAGFINSEGNFVKAGREDIQAAVGQKAEEFAPIAGTTEFEQRRSQEQSAIEGQQLAGQVGEFNQLGVSPTGLDVGEGLVSGLTDAIPRALTLAGGAAIAGATAGAFAGPAAPVASPVLAAAAAATTFVGSIASSMIGNFKSQRRDTTTAQQRVLDEGKQTMKDWATLARNDPARREFYLGQYNLQSAQIDQAFRQMKLDTSRDVTKFETALPNLAEFNSFYAIGGERDSLNQEMINALTAPSPEGYNMLDLTNRRSP